MKLELDRQKYARELQLKKIVDAKQIRNQLQLKIEKISLKIESLENNLNNENYFSQLQEEEEINQVRDYLIFF